MIKWDTEQCKAILDIVYFDQQLQEVALDVNITDGAEKARPTSRLSLNRVERRKHARYPGSNMHPLVFDCRGKWGKEAQAFVAGVVKGLDLDERYSFVSKIRSRVSLAIQQSVAEQVLSAASRQSTPARPRRKPNGLFQ